MPDVLPLGNYRIEEVAAPFGYVLNENYVEVKVDAQRPHATLVADYDTWKKVDRYVMRGSKGIAIFPSRALNTHLRHVFDIKDTGGRNVKLTWDLTGDTLKEYAQLDLENEKVADADLGGIEEEKSMNVAENQLPYQTRQDKPR